MNPQANWWNRACGGKEVLALALPLMISTGSWSLMLFVDRMLLLWHSREAIAAALPAGCAFWTAMCFPLGTAGFVSTFVAQYHGANRPERIGAVVWQGLWIGVLSLPLFLLLIPLAPYLFAWAGHEAAVAELETVYFQILMWSASANVLAAAQAGFFAGRGRTSVVMVVDVSSVLLNVLLDAVLILGLLGLPRLGIVGAGWATVAASWAKVAAYGWLMARDRSYDAFRLRESWRPDVALFRRLLVYGAPSGLQQFVEAGSFTLLTLLMGRFGTLAMTATTLALNVNAVAVIPIIGLSVAASIAVGQQITQGRADLAVRATWSSVVIGLVYTLSFATLYVLIPDLFVGVLGVGADAAQFAEVRELTTLLLRFVAVFCVLDGMQMVFSGAIKGAGDTWFVFIATIVLSIAAIVVCQALSFWGLFGWWLGITLWVAALAVAFVTRFLQGKWQRMRVIESDAQSDAEIVGIDIDLRPAVEVV